MDKNKFTKGKWGVKLHDGKYWKVINENNETICNINSRSTLKIKEENSNAQLITHAPEMLEMLNHVKYYLGSEQREKVEALIKSATEV